MCIQKYTAYHCGHVMSEGTQRCVLRAEPLSPCSGRDLSRTRNHSDDLCAACVYLNPAEERAIKKVKTAEYEARLEPYDTEAIASWSRSSTPMESPQNRRWVNPADVRSPPQSPLCPPPGAGPSHRDQDRQGEAGSSRHQPLQAQESEQGNGRLRFPRTLEEYIQCMTRWTWTAEEAEQDWYQRELWKLYEGR